MKRLVLLKNEGDQLAIEWEYAFEHMASEVPLWIRARIEQIYKQWPDLRPTISVLDTPTMLTGQVSDTAEEVK